ncbi:phage holin family protein [Paenibacillus lautus]
MIGLLGFSVEAIIQGMLAGAFAVFGHQAIKQTKERIQS